MSLQDKVMGEMKAAMKAKDTAALTALRAVKSELLLAQTNAATKEGLSEEEEIKLLQKLVKQRKDSAAIYTEQGRADLAEPEIAEAAIIEKFLPEVVETEDTGVKSVNPDNLTWYLVNAVKELSARVEELESKSD